MRPTQPLADLLRRTARRIEAQHLLFFDLEYRWNDSARCNCGLLVRQALDMDEEKLRQQISRGTWQRISRAVFENAEHTQMEPHSEPIWDPRSPGPVCASTGLSLGFVFNHMAQLGFDQPEDFEHLEDLNHPVIQARLRAQGEERLRKDHAPHVVLYMREMANWIEAQLQIQAVRQAQMQSQAELIHGLMGTRDWIEDRVQNPQAPLTVEIRELL